MPTDTFEKVQELKALLVSAGRGRARGPEDEALFKDLRDELLRMPNIRTLLPVWLREYRGIGEFWPFIKSQSTTWAGRDDFLRREFEPLLSHLEAQRLGASATSQQFFAAGSEHAAYVEIRKIVSTTQGDVLIVDPYVDHTMWTLLTNVSAGTSVRVLTQNMKGDFLLEAQKFAKQHDCSVQVRATTSFHDRFIVIDGSKCWHLGASIKDAGAKAFLISEIHTEAVRKATINAVQSEWQCSSPA